MLDAHSSRLAPRDRGPTARLALGDAGPSTARAAVVCAALCVALTALRCADAPVPLDPLPTPTCKCQPPAPCPKDVCDVQIDVAKVTCATEVGRVEVMIGTTLEPATFFPGEARRTCATIPRGTQARLVARADTLWQWVEQVACPPASAADTAGVTLVRVLSCAVAPSGADAGAAGPDARTAKD